MSIDFVSNLRIPNTEESRMKIKTVMSIKSSECRSWMQINRPWTDRTGEAKRRLNAEYTQESETVHAIVLSQGVDYGLALETRDGGKYSVIKPCAKTMGPEVMRSLERVLL